MSNNNIQGDVHSENLRSLFATFDSDRDGKISSSEVVLALQTTTKACLRMKLGI